VIAPTDPGPQTYNTGGSIVLWRSSDQGHQWTKMRDMTPGCTRNQSYPRRPVDANPDFYAFWADGNGRKPSESHLYFSNKQGNVFELPYQMTTETAKPKEVFVH
jgi:hypothetical protein